MEIIDRYDTNIYRAVYTAQFSNVISVLHAFQKKSKRGLRPRKRTLNSSAADSPKLSGLTGKGAINNGD